MCYNLTPTNSTQQEGAHNNKVPVAPVLVIVLTLESRDSGTRDRTDGSRGDGGFEAWEQRLTSSRVRCWVWRGASGTPRHEVPHTTSCSYFSVASHLSSLSDCEKQYCFRCTSPRKAKPSASGAWDLRIVLLRTLVPAETVQVAPAKSCCREPDGACRYRSRRATEIPYHNCKVTLSGAPER